MDDFEDIDENISLGLISFDQIINYSIIVKKYFTCSQLIFYINQIINEQFKGFGDITDLIYLFKGNILPFSSATLESLKLKDGDIILIEKIESKEDDNENLNIKKKRGSIKITALSREEDIFLPMTVDIHMTSAQLITLLNQLIKNVLPEKVKNGFFFIHKNKKLNFDARSLKSLNFEDKDKILICSIENANIIDDDCNLIAFKKPDDLIAVTLVSSNQFLHLVVKVNINFTCTEFILTLVKKIMQFYPEKSKNEFFFLWKGQKLNYSSIRLFSMGVKNGDVIMAMEIEPLFEKDLDLDASIIIDEENQHQNAINFDIHGILKFCIIKEMSSFIDKNFDLYKQRLTKKIKYILEVISGGNIDLNQTENSIISVLKKFEGINILNFSRFIDEYINQNELLDIYKIFKKEEKMDIRKKNNCLHSYSEYMKKFEEEFDIARKNSIFEYRLTSMTIVDRNDLNSFETNKDKCPNRINKILFHGTGINPSSKILTDMFLRSEKKSYQFGKGVYFTDSLDYAWYYGGKDNRDNLNKIPKVDQTFILVGSYIYYDKNGFKRVYDHKYTPKKNEINFALADSKTKTIFSEKPDKSKFYGTEYVIHDFEQICPFLGCSLKRDEYCVIWRDSNFSPNPVYNNKFDDIFKKFLKKRMEYIQELIKFNVYPCETSEEALELVNRKKYNKIILISNAGSDLSGRKFVIDARKIIGNDVIALFLCYNIEHLKWITKLKNAIFSNEPEFYEKYLESFVTNSEIDEESKEKIIKSQLIKLILEIQKKYKVNFNFDNNFLKYPLFKNDGHFSDLKF